MVERMFVGEEKQSLEKLKEEARVAKELQLTPVWPVKTEPDAETGPVEGATAVQQTLLINGKRESSPEIHQPAKATLKTQPKVSICLPHAKFANWRKLLLDGAVEVHSERRRRLPIGTTGVALGSRGIHEKQWPSPCGCNGCVRHVGFVAALWWIHRGYSARIGLLRRRAGRRRFRVRHGMFIRFSSAQTDATRLPIFPWFFHLELG